MLLLTFNVAKAEYVLGIAQVEKEFEFVREQDELDESEILHPYYQLSDGSFVSKQAVCKAIQLLERFVHGHSPMYLTEAELFAHGNEVEAVQRYRQKYNCSLREAKSAIDTLRGNTDL